METRLLKKITIAATFGFLIGFVAGLLGVGGGEFRIPVLICVIGFLVPIAASSNLLIGLLTVSVGLTSRLIFGLALPPIYGVIIAMSLASILGAYMGASITGKIKEVYLRWALAILLVSLGLKLVYDAFTHEESFGLGLIFPMDVIAGFIFGFLIGILCGTFGVAGGEMRIPVFIYIFGLTIKAAGTASLLVSIPAIASGAFKHHRLNHMNQDVKIISIAMGVPSAIGALMGASLVSMTADVHLKLLLGVILLLATVRIVVRNEDSPRK